VTKSTSILSTAVLGAVAAIAFTCATTGGALAADVVRHKIPNSDFPIALAVEVPADKTTVYVSGTVPPMVDEAAPKNSIKAYGDTKTQTVGVLTEIEKILKTAGIDMGDVVKMQVFLVGDPSKEGRMDFAGFMEGYRQFFGTSQQPNLPARSAMQVAGLVNPGWLVEIEVTAVKP
jgi:enamine deaminase RidA (YjgF/YER057c/UK114 family)